MTEKLKFKAIDDAMMVLEFLKNPEILDALKHKGLTIDWKALFDYIAEGIVVDMNLNDKKQYVRSLSDSELDKLATCGTDTTPMGTQTLREVTNDDWAV